ncbi:MAG: ABC transporter permease [Acidobacteria bacterium]|nr:ABC transporter permease [Acidobacteriota bacterium]
MLNRLLAYVRGVRHRRTIDAEAREELEFHLAAQVEANLALGIARAEAERRARRDLGGLSSTADAVQHVRTTPFDALIRDVRYACRCVRRERGFTTTVVLTVALGIGASTATVSVVHAVLLRPLPYPTSERLFAVIERAANDPPASSGFASVDTYELLQQDQDAVDGVVAYGTPLRTLRLNRDVVRLRTATVSSSVFPMLGVRPLRGRFFSNEEDTPGAAPVVVISEALWRDRLSAEDGAIGRSLLLDGVAFTIVGIAPATFTFPDPEVALWTSHARHISQLKRWNDSVLVRLGPGIAPATISARVTDLLHQRQAPSGPGARPADAHRVQLVPLLDSLTAPVRQGVILLVVAGVAVLIVAGANILNLFVVRGLGRRRELAMRVALGAAKSRIAAGLLAHSLLIGAAGGALGLALALAILRLLVWLAPSGFPRVENVSITPAVLAFVGVSTLVLAVLSGMVTLWRPLETELILPLRESPVSMGSSSSGVRGTTRALVTGQIALSCALLIVSGLVVRSFLELTAVDPGYRPAGVLTAQVSFPPGTPSARQRALAQELVQRLSQVPAAHGVGLTNALPLEKVRTVFVLDPPAESPMAVSGRLQPDFRVVTPGYFGAVGMRLLQGRFFSDADDLNRPLAAVVNESFARRFLPDTKWIGAAIVPGPDRPSWTVVGVVQDVHYTGLDQAARPTLYASMWQRDQVAFFNRFDVVIRADVIPAAFAPALRALVREVDPELAIYQVTTMAEQLQESVARPRLYSWVVTVFAMVAVVVAAIGLYGALAYAVSLRARELAVRMALGASTTAILRMLSREAAVNALLAISIGCALGYGAARLLRGQLFGIEAFDVATFVLVSLIVAIACLVASATPIARAIRVQPARLLRGE